MAEWLQERFDYSTFEVKGILEGGEIIPENFTARDSIVILQLKLSD